jgi:hypothetical protein
MSVIGFTLQPSFIFAEVIIKHTGTNSKGTFNSTTQIMKTPTSTGSSTTISHTGPKVQRTTTVNTTDNSDGTKTFTSQSQGTVNGKSTSGSGSTPTPVIQDNSEYVSHYTHEGTKGSVSGTKEYNTSTHTKSTTFSATGTNGGTSEGVVVNRGTATHLTTTPDGTVNKGSTLNNDDIAHTGSKASVTSEQTSDGGGLFPEKVLMLVL